MAENKRKMTVSEAGHLGGEKVSKERGHDFYSEIGKKGGRAGGKKGGEATKRTHGHDFYEEIGHMGGQKVRRLIQKGEEAESSK